MKQCTKILDNEEQCSNRAIPGTDFCEQHRKRTQFMRVPTDPAESTPVSPAPAVRVGPKETGRKKPSAKKTRSTRKPKSSDAGTTTQPTPLAVPVSVGQVPGFQSLRADVRNILVAPQGAILLRTDDEPSVRGRTLWQRLGRLLSCLSEDFLFPSQLTVRLSPDETIAVLLLTPAESATVDLSSLYDRVSSAAAQSGGTLYIGKGSDFIRYRDTVAPRGYDVATDPAPAASQGMLRLFDTTKTVTLEWDTLPEARLSDLLLRLHPLRRHDAERPEEAFVLANAALYRMLARYFTAHRLRYRLASWEERDSGRKWILFQITPPTDIRTGRSLPQFILSYLARLPSCVVLTEVTSPTDRQLLVQWMYRFPCHVHNSREAFPQDSMTLFIADSDLPNQCISPIPRFFESEDLTEAYLPDAGPTHGTLGSDKPPALAVPVRLIRHTGPTPTISALILDEQQVTWVRQLLYRLPATAFASYRFCLGKNYSILLSEEHPIEGIPFGTPLRRVQDSHLFLPLHTRFTPELPLSLLLEVLEVNGDHYSFFSEKMRLDVRCKHFEPLSRLLIAESDQHRVSVELHPPITLPILQWTAPKPTEATASPETESSKTATVNASNTPKLRLLDRILNRTPSSPPDANQQTLTAPPAPSPVAFDPTDKQLVQELLTNVEIARLLFRDRAEKFLTEQDYLNAATCYVLAEDPANAARCYRDAARRIRVPMEDQEEIGRAS